MQRETDVPNEIHIAGESTQTQTQILWDPSKKQLNVSDNSILSLRHIVSISPRATKEWRLLIVPFQNLKLASIPFFKA